MQKTKKTIAIFIMFQICAILFLHLSAIYLYAKPLIKIKPDLIIPHTESILFEWSAYKYQNTENISIIEISENNKFNPLVYSYKTENNFVEVSSLKPGIYYWRIGSINGVNIKYSQINFFSIVTETQGKIAKIITEFMAASQENPFKITVLFNQFSFNKSIHFQVSNESNFSTPLIDEEIKNTNYFFFLKNGGYFCRSRIKYADADSGDWSEPIFFSLNYTEKTDTLKLKRRIICATDFQILSN